MSGKLASLVTLLVFLPNYHCSILPNILFVLVDDLGWTDVGYHNISIIRTPNIDRLASEGVTLDNYYVQAVCTPTRSALLTGRYPIHTGMQHEVVRPDTPYGLPLDLQLLPQKMKEAGYVTHIVGKWHLGYFEWEYTPTYRGFDTFYGLYNGAAGHFDHKRNGILDFRDQKAPVTNQDGVYSTYSFSKRAEEIIMNHNASVPLFLYLPFQNVHAPTEAPERFVDKYKDIKDKIRRTYAGMVGAVDEAIANVTNAMKNKGLWNNTLMVFSTDNGGMPFKGGYNWPLRGCKSTLWEGGVRGAAFVHGNMIEKKRRRSKELIHVTDWFPTLMSLAGLKIPSSLDGVNIWNTLSRGDPSPRTEILLNIDPGTTQGIAIRVQHMKLLVNVISAPWFTPPEINNTATPDWKDFIALYKSNRLKVALFNITADPEERQDLSTKLPDVVARLMERIDFYKKGLVPPRNKPPDAKAKETAKRNGVWGPWDATQIPSRSWCRTFNVEMLVCVLWISTFVC